MKKLTFLMLVSILMVPVASARDINDANARKQIVTVETKTFDTVRDIPLRIGGFVATLVGTGLFIGTSPITGLMTAIYPHTAIDDAADFLVLRPGRYTFVRPVGDSNYDTRLPSEQ